MQFPVPHFSDEVLLSLCDNSDNGQGYVTRQAINDEIHNALKQSPLAKLLGGRIYLGDRYPIVGKNLEGTFTKNLVGFSYHGKRVTIPTFGICAGPTLPADNFRLRNIKLLRQVFAESVEAICKTELNYFYALLQSAGAYNSNYKLFSAKEITIDVLLEATQPMVDHGITPKAVFMHPEGVENLERLTPLLDRLGITLLTSKHCNSDVYVFGQPVDDSCTNAHLMCEGTSFTVRSKDSGINTWREPVTLEQSLKEGFLLGSLGSLLISRKAFKPRGTKFSSTKERVQAFIVGEQGSDIVQMYEP